MPKTQLGAKGNRGGQQREVAEGLGNATATGKSEHEKVNALDSNSITSDAKLERARQRIHDAQEWRETYDDANDYIMRRLAEEYEAGRRLSLQIIWEELRRYEWCGRRGESFRLNNSLRAAIARLIVRECPQYAGRLELRRSPLDEVFKVRTDA